MNCDHKPASYLKMLTEGENNLVCRHCGAPIRIENAEKALRLRKLIVLVPALLVVLCMLPPVEKLVTRLMPLPAWVGAAILLPLVAWFVLCRFVFHYVGSADSQ